MNLRARRVHQTGFRRISAIGGIVDGLSLRNGDRHVDFFVVSPLLMGQGRRCRRILAQHHGEFLRAVRVFRRALHQSQRLGVVALLLIDLDQIPVSARMRRRDVLNQRLVDGNRFVCPAELRVGLPHQHQRIDVVRLALDGNAQHVQRAGKVRLLKQLPTQCHICVRVGNRPAPRRHQALPVLRSKEHVAAGGADEQREQHNDKHHTHEPLVRLAVDRRVHQCGPRVNLAADVIRCAADVADLRLSPGCLLAQTNRDAAGAVRFISRAFRSLRRGYGPPLCLTGLLSFVFDLICIRGNAPRDAHRFARFREIGVGLSAPEYPLHGRAARTYANGIGQLPSAVWTNHEGSSSL